MGFGLCAICGNKIEAGTVVVAEVSNNKVKSHAHGECWTASGKTIMLPPIVNPRESVLTLSGHWLDSIGALTDVDLPRHPIETDHDYRVRLVEKMREDASHEAS